FSAPPPTAIYTLSLHDALPISEVVGADQRLGVRDAEHRAQREDRLVLGHLSARARELAFGDRVLLAARHRTLQARRVPVVEVGLHLLAAHQARLGEDL